jgi:GT2 family glycosyltransferase
MVAQKNPSPDSIPMRMNLDEPADGQEFAFGEVFVRGWALDTGGRADVEAKLAGLGPIRIASGKTRTDVARAFPRQANAAYSGFGGRIDVSSLAPGEHEIVVTIRGSTGDVVEVRRSIKLLDRTLISREAMAKAGNDFVRLKIDSPSEGSSIYHGSILRADGWAVASSGIDRVSAWLDDEGPYITTFGLLNEEVGSLYDDFLGAARPGFVWIWPTSGLRPGVHSLRFVATSKGRAEAESTALFTIGARTEYELWAELNRLSGDQIISLLDAGDSFFYKPRISVVTPVYRTPREFLLKCVDSVRKQAYPNWELVLVDDGSGDDELWSLLQILSQEDKRIRVKALTSNQGIAAATNAGLAICSGDYVALLDHDDEIAPDALLRIVEMLNQDRSLDVLYSDEDKIDEHNRHVHGFFKPEWSPDLLLSMNYVCHFLTCRRSLLQEVGGLRRGFDGSQDYDLMLRLSERTNRIRRVPRVLYHWRIHPASTANGVSVKPAASEAGRRALHEHLQRKQIPAKVIEQGPGRYRVKYALNSTPEVAIVIPTGGSPTLETALQSIFRSTRYPNYSVIVVDNSSGVEVQSRLKTFHEKSQILSSIDRRGVAFNFSLLCNEGARASSAPYLLFLNDDTEVITPDWIECMLEHAQFPDVGAVGALLLFPNNTIQHAGVIAGLYEVAGHPFRGFPNKPHYFDFSHVIRDCCAVTGACLLIGRSDFESVGGFDEMNLPTCFQDVDLCLKLVMDGKRIVYTPFAKLYHHESFSKKAVADLPEIQYMKERWSGVIANDPYYNPNLTRRADDYSLRYDPLFLARGVESQPRASPSRFISPEASRTASVVGKTSAVRRSERFGAIEFYATPNPAKPIHRGLTKTKLSWVAPGAEKVQIRVGSPNGPLLAEGGPVGDAETGAWVESGTVFYLQDASEGDPTSPDEVLAIIRVRVGESDEKHATATASSA